MLFLLGGEIVKDLAAARIARDASGPRIELQATAFGGDGDPQRVTRKQQIGVARLGIGVTSRTALFAGAVNLHNALRRGKTASRGDFLDERLDVRAQKFEGPITAFAD